MVQFGRSSHLEDGEDPKGCSLRGALLRTSAGPQWRPHTACCLSLSPRDKVLPEVWFLCLSACQGSVRSCPVLCRAWECYHCPTNLSIFCPTGNLCLCLSISLGSLQDTVLDACSPETPAVTSQPTMVLPEISEGGLGELESVKQELQALQEELRGAAVPRWAEWEARVS